MKKLFRRLGIVLVVLAAGIVSAGLIAKYWIIPGIIAAEIESAAAEQWDGQVKVGAVEFSYFAPILIRNIDFRDRAQRLWLHIGSVELALRNWPGVSPVLTAVDVHEVEVSMHVIDGRLDLPIRKQEEPPSPVDMDRYVDIQRLNIQDISCTVVDDQSHRATWVFRQFEAIKQPGGVYRVSLTSPPDAEHGPAGGGQTISLDGSVDHKTYDADLVLHGNLSADRSRMAALLSVMNVDVIKAIDGRLRSDRARLRGRLDAPGLWRLSGQIDLKGFQFEGRYGHLAKELDCAMTLDGRTIRITRFNANGCGGTVTASGQADIDAGWTVTYRGMLDATNVNVPMLTETVTGPDNKAQRGALSLRVKYSGVGSSIQGSGLLGLDNADVMTLSIFAEVFKRMNLGNNDQLRKSDVRAAFTFNGPQVTIEHGRLANPLSAIDVERGGKINVQTRQLDLHVMGVPLKAVEDILNLPIVNILSEPFRNLRNKLIRLRVRGDWSASPSTLITKQPVEDVSKGTVGFFKDVAKSGGKLGKGALKIVDDVFRALGGGS